MNLHCTHRNYQIKAEVIEHPDSPMPWEAGCRITTPEGEVLHRQMLPMKQAFLTDLNNAQHVSVAHGRWLVDQHLDHGLVLH